jgi:hypothetical protein
LPTSQPVPIPGVNRALEALPPAFTRPAPPCTPGRHRTAPSGRDVRTGRPVGKPGERAGATSRAGQLAIAAAEAWDQVPNVGTGEKTRDRLAEIFGFGKTYVQQARALVQHAPRSRRSGQERHRLRLWRDAAARAFAPTPLSHLSVRAVAVDYAMGAATPPRTPRPGEGRYFASSVGTKLLPTRPTFRALMQARGASRRLVRHRGC